MGRIRTAQSHRKVRSKKSSRKRESQDEPAPYIALKARLLSAVYRVSHIDESYKGTLRRASHQAIKKHLLERQQEHRERYPILRDTALTRAKQELVEDGLLVKPNRASFAPSKEVRLQYKDVRDHDDGPSEDEATAAAYLNQFKKALRELPDSEPDDDTTDDSESDVEDLPREVPISGRGKQSKKGKGRTTKASSVRVKTGSSSKKPATKKRKVRAASSSSEDEDQLESSSADEAPVRTKGKRPVKTRPKQEINPATGRPKVGALGRLRKAELVEKVTALQDTNAVLLKELEKERKDYKKLKRSNTSLEHDHAELERSKAILSKGFLQLEAEVATLKARLAASAVANRLDALDADDEASTDQGDQVVEADEAEGVEQAMSEEQDLGGYEEPMWGQHDDSGYGEGFDVDITTSHKSRESSPAFDLQRSTPGLVDAHAELPVDRHSPQPFLETVNEQEEERGFDQSYPELMLDSQSQREASAHKSWASIHPPSPASSSDGHGRAQQRFGDLEVGPSGEKRNAYPTPNLSSSSPVKLGSHTIFQRDDDEEGSVVASTVIVEEFEEMMLSIDGHQEEENKIRRLERDIVDLRTRLGGVDLAKELVKQELDIVTRRYQDQVESSSAELSNANESRLVIEEKVTSLESDLNLMRQIVGDETRRVAQLQAELIAAEAELASVNAARSKGEATLQATKEELELVSHRFQDGVAESTQQFSQLDLKYSATQEHVKALGSHLEASNRQLQAAHVRVHDLETSLEQAKSTHADLVKVDIERQDRLLAASRTVDELTARVHSLETAQDLASNEQASLVARLSHLEQEKGQIDSKLLQASKELAEHQRGSGLLRDEMEIISQRYRDQVGALSTDLDTVASESVELESQISTLEGNLSDTKAQLTEERNRANQLQTTLTNAKVSHDETLKQKETSISELQTIIDELNRDLLSARSAHETIVVEKGALESQLSVVRQQAQQTFEALEKKARTSGALSAEMDLVSQHYRDATETSTGRIDELENEFEEAQEKITDLEDELSRAETSAEEAKFRVEELEEKLITADESYAELVKLNEKREAALAESTSKLEDAIANISALASTQGTLERDKASLEHDLTTLQKRLDLSKEAELRQISRLESLQFDLETMAKAYQEQGKEAAENVALVEEQLSIAEIDAATLKEELDVIHAALLDEQTHSQKLANQLEGTTESYNAVANQKELLSTALTTAEAKGDQLYGLVADLDTLRAEKATLGGHSIMLEQDLATARAQLSTVKSSLEEAKTASDALYKAIESEKEAHNSDIEKLEKLQVSYKVVYEAESQLRSQLRSLVNSRGLASSTDFSDPTGAPLSYISSIRTDLVDLDRQLSKSAGQLDSAQALANQILASFPDHLISPLQTNSHDEEVVSLDKSLRQALNRLSLLVEAAESASAELEETRDTLTATQVILPTVDSSTSTEYQLERVLETLDSKLRELDAVLAFSAEEETTIDIGESPLSGHDNLPLLVEQIKTRVQSFEHVDEQRKSETRSLKEELVEEVAKRSRAVLKLKEKTEECLKLQEQVDSLKEKQSKALSFIKQGSIHLEA